MGTTTFLCGEFLVDAANRRLMRGEVECAVEPKVFAVIVQLVTRPGMLVTRNELLDAVWGHRYVGPSTLSRVIALARRAFGDDIDEPRYIQTVHGAGYRYVGPVSLETSASTGVPTQFGPPPTVRPPARIEPLIGREHELALLAELLASNRAVTLLGTGGMGKTQCALEFARNHRTEYPDGVWFFDLAPITTAAEWLQAFGRALAIPSLDNPALLAKICLVLSGRRTLLLLDNCDRLAADLGAWVFEVLRRVDDVKVLATSQRPLSFVGERLMHMPPLSLPEQSDSVADGNLADIEASPAVHLLVTRVRLHQPGFVLTTANAATVIEICRRLDGMPLALELAAARFALLSPDQVLKRLEHRFSFLTSDTAGRDHRHRNLLALLEWSYSLLTLQEQRLLNWICVFELGWTMEAAIEVTAALGGEAELGVDLVAGLVGKSLVAVDPSLVPPRYRLLETVRDFALARLRASGDEARARSAHLEFVRGLTARAHADMVCGRMRERVAQLMYEHGNIEVALQYAAVSITGGNSALAIVGSLLVYLKAHGAYVTAPLWCRRALEAPGASDLAARGRALLTLGVVTVHVPDPRLDAGELLAQAAAIAEKFSDRWSAGYASGYRALYLVNTGQCAAAERIAAATHRIASDLGDPLLLGLAGLARGWVQMAYGDFEGAVTTLNAVRHLGHDLHQQHFIDMYIGLCAFSLGDNSAAAKTWHEAMQASAAVGNLRGVSGAVEGCGYLAARLQQYQKAARLLVLARRIRERTRVPLFMFWTRHHEAAATATQLALGAADWTHLELLGVNGREEDTIDEAAALLRSFSR